MFGSFISLTCVAAKANWYLNTFLLLSTSW